MAVEGERSAEGKRGEEKGMTSVSCLASKKGDTYIRLLA